MRDPGERLAKMWDELLSGEPERVRIAYNGLSKGEKQAVLAHLHEMAEGEGWQAGQREAARVAIVALKK